MRGALFLFLAGCGPCDAPAIADASADVALEAEASAPATPRAPEIERLWEEARDLGEDELARLANAEGPAGLEERASDPALRLIALSAMGHTRTLEGLALLGESARRDPEPLALVAAKSAEMLASIPRRSRDPEDALEVKRGCDDLRATVADPARPKPVKDSAKRALGMLAELCAP